MATIPELLDGHVTLEVECLDRLYLNGYIGPLATSGGLVTRARFPLCFLLDLPTDDAGDLSKRGSHFRAAHRRPLNLFGNFHRDKLMALSI